MNDEYLWDKSGEDPEIEVLERALSPLRHREIARAAPAVPPAAPDPGPVAEGDRVVPIRPRRSRGAVAIAIAFAASLAIAGVVTYPMRPRPEQARALPPVVPTEVPSSDTTEAPPEVQRLAGTFEVKRLTGAPQCGSQWMAGDCQLGVGQWLETGEGASAEIAIADIGKVRVDPGSRVRLSATGASEHRLELERGKIQARVDAPPRLFQVTTPAATAVDLGCAYALEVAEGGDGWLSVTSGYVSLEWKKRTSLVAAGSRCEMKKDFGPGTPFFDDARAPLKAAVHAFDFEKGGEEAVRIVLSEARRRDSLTLWHLLFRVDRSIRAQVVERLKTLVPPPPGVTDEDAMTPDAARLQPWKDRMVKTW